MRAFGYEPDSIPASHLFDQPATPAQASYLFVLADTRKLADWEALCDAILDEYGVSGMSKGAASLVIDFMTKAGNGAIRAAEARVAERVYGQAAMEM